MRRLTRAAKCINNAGVVNEWPCGASCGAFLWVDFGVARGDDRGISKRPEKLYFIGVWVRWVIFKTIYF